MPECHGCAASLGKPPQKVLNGTSGFLEILFKTAGNPSGGFPSVLDPYSGLHCISQHRRGVAWWGGVLGTFALGCLQVSLLLPRNASCSPGRKGSSACLFCSMRSCCQHPTGSLCQKGGSATKAAWQKTGQSIS